MNKQQVNSVLIAAGHINDVTHPGNNCGSHRNGLDIPYTSQWGCCHLANNCGSHRNGLDIPYTSQWAAAI